MVWTTPFWINIEDRTFRQKFYLTNTGKYSILCLQLIQYAQFHFFPRLSGVLAGQGSFHSPAHTTLGAPKRALFFYARQGTRPCAASAVWGCVRGAPGTPT